MSTPASQSACLAKGGAAKSRAAAEIEHGAETHCPPGGRHHGVDGTTQQLRPAIGELFGECRVVASGILIEQAADIRISHARRGVAGPEPGEMEPRAVKVLRIEVARCFEGGNRAAPIAELVAKRAQSGPGRSECGRERDGLDENIGGAGKLAARGKVERPPVAPVGDEIAGRGKERAGISHCVIPGRAQREPGIHNHRPIDSAKSGRWTLRQPHPGFRNGAEGARHQRNNISDSDAC